MVDPASAATALQLAGVACKGIEWLWKVVRELQLAPRHVQELEEELRYTQYLLNNSSSLLEPFSHEGDDNVHSYDPLAILRSEFRKLIVIIDGVKDGDDVSRRRWLLKARECGRLTEKVRRHRERIRDLISLVQSPAHAPASQDDALFQALMRMLQRDETVLAIEPAPVDSTEANSLLRVPQSGSVMSRRHSAGPLSASSRVPDKDIIGPQPLGNTEACLSGCRCTCHFAQARRNSTQSVRAAIAPVASRVGQISFTSKCSLSECKAMQSRRGQLTYSFPSRLLHRIFTVSLLYEGLRFRSYLKVPLYVPDFSDVVRAAVNGDLGTLQRLFAARLAHVNDTGLDGWTLLHNAAYNGHNSMVQFLIREGANQEAVELNNRKASHFAMIKAVKQSATPEDKNVVLSFGGRGAESFREDFRMTPIHACVLHLREDQGEGDTQLLFELLELVERANHCSFDQDWSELYPEYTDQSPFFTEILDMYRERAAQLRAGNRGKNPVFLDLRNQPDAHNWTPLHWAAYAGRFHEMKTLLENGAQTVKLTTSQRNILHHAAESGDEQLLEYLFQERNSLSISTMKVDQQDLWGETPLHIAATRSAKSVSHLIDHGARMDLVQAEGQTALHFAGQAPHKDMTAIADVLTQHCPQLVKMKDEGGRTPIFEFLRSLECVKLLLSRKADVNVRDHRKRSLVHEACFKGYPEALEMIMAQCDRKIITSKDADGFTPLAAAFACCTPRSAQCAAFILKLDGVKIDPKPDKEGWTPIHHAAKLGDLEVLELVLGRFQTSDLVGNSKQSLEQIASGGLGRWEGDFKERLQKFEKEALSWSIAKDKKTSKGEIYENYAMIMR